MIVGNPVWSSDLEEKDGQQNDTSEIRSEPEREWHLIIQGDVAESLARNIREDEGVLRLHLSPDEGVTLIAISHPMNFVAADNLAATIYGMGAFDCYVEENEPPMATLGEEWQSGDVSADGTT